MDDRNDQRVLHARVSTRDQDINAQVAEQMAAGCAKVYREKASGAKTDRAELAKVMSKVGARRRARGAPRLDRLARSTRDLLNIIIEALTQRGAGFKSLKDTWADTTSPHGRLMRTALSRAWLSSSGNYSHWRSGRKRAKGTRCEVWPISANGRLVSYSTAGTLSAKNQTLFVQDLLTGTVQTVASFPRSTAAMFATSMDLRCRHRPRGILIGALERPGIVALLDLPVQAPTKYELLVNLQDCEGARPHRTRNASGPR